LSAHYVVGVDAVVVGCFLVVVVRGAVVVVGRRTVVVERGFVVVVFGTVVDVVEVVGAGPTYPLPRCLGVPSTYTDSPFVTSSGK
jgi:hypothetical protein